MGCFYCACAKRDSEGPTSVPSQLRDNKCTKNKFKLNRRQGLQVLSYTVYELFGEFLFRNNSPMKIPIFFNSHFYLFLILNTSRYIW